MKKLRVNRQVNDDGIVYFINIESMDLFFDTQKEANSALEAMITLLRRNSGLAKQKERNVIADKLYDNGFPLAADYLKGGESGQSAN
jgi:hypothetical protein